MEDLENKKQKLEDLISKRRNDLTDIEKDKKYHQSEFDFYTEKEDEALNDIESMCQQLNDIEEDILNYEEPIMESMEELMDDDSE